METRDTKYCVYCGKEIPIDSKRGVHCGEWLEESSVSKNLNGHTYTSNEEENIENESSGHVPNERVESKSSPTVNKSNNINHSNTESITEYSKILPIRRLFLLMILTLNLYSIYWIYKTNCYLRDDLGKDVDPALRTIVYAFVPIANIIIFYMTIDDMNSFIKKEGIETYSSTINTIIMVFFSWIISFWVYVNVQESINEFWRIKEPNLPIRRDFSNSEIIGMSVVFLFWVLLFFLYIFILIIIISEPGVMY